MLIFIAQSRLFGKHYWPVKVQNMFYQAIDTLGKDQWAKSVTDTSVQGKYRLPKNFYCDGC